MAVRSSRNDLKAHQAYIDQLFVLQKNNKPKISNAPHYQQEQVKTLEKQPVYEEGFIASQPKIQYKYSNIMDIIDDKMKDINALSENLKSNLNFCETSIRDLNQLRTQLKQELHGEMTKYDHRITEIEKRQMIPGPKGDPGERGPPGAQGKVGPKGLSGKRGAQSLMELNDVDIEISQLKDGCVLMWQAKQKKFVPVLLEDETEEDDNEKEPVSKKQRPAKIQL